MPASVKQYKAALVQAEPGWFDLARSVQKTIDFINEAGAAGCKFVAFPEVWIPGYPYWQWRVTYQDTLPLLKAYRQNSLRPDSEEMLRIRAAARKNGIYVSLGYSEIDVSSLYMAQLIISPTGAVINHRRKIKPTHVEKLVFGEGSGESLTSVVETEIGKLGHLNCWENLNPFLKAHAAALGEQVHVAAWPVYPPETTLKYPDPWTNVADPNANIVSPSYAIETGTWVLAPFQTVSAEGAKLNTPERLRSDSIEGLHCGFSRIYKPDGSRAVADPDRDYEGLVFVDIDLDEAHLPKALADLGGHYTRPDLIRLLVDKTPKTQVVDGKDLASGKFPSTLERLGLNKDLPPEQPAIE
ncbi:MAG: hypothetical protein M1819_000445 [Sarea resinae]|nr:MAG: hypothetical protein M1819_000445 [Sarea resinae]